MRQWNITPRCPHRHWNSPQCCPGTCGSWIYFFRIHLWNVRDRVAWTSLSILWLGQESLLNGGWVFGNWDSPRVCHETPLSHWLDQIDGAMFFWLSSTHPSNPWKLLTTSIIPSVKLGSGPSHPNQPSIGDIYLLLGDLAAAFSLPITEKVN